MAITFTCRCGNTITVADAAQKAQCLACGHILSHSDSRPSVADIEATEEDAARNSSSVPTNQTAQTSPFDGRSGVDDSQSAEPVSRKPRLVDHAAVKWVSQQLARAGRFLRDVAAYYWVNRLGMWRRYANAGDDAREVELDPDRRYKKCRFDETGWHVQLPASCVVCGEMADTEDLEETRQVEDFTGPLWLAFGGVGVGLILWWMFDSVLAWGTAIVAGCVLGFLNRRWVNVSIAFRRCGKHASVTSVPRLRIAGNKLTVGVGHRDLKQKFTDVNSSKTDKPVKERFQDLVVPSEAGVSEIAPSQPEQVASAQRGESQKPGVLPEEASLALTIGSDHSVRRIQHKDWLHGWRSGTVIAVHDAEGRFDVQFDDGVEQSFTRAELLEALDAGSLVILEVAKGTPFPS
jgi:hypothetical protein